MKRIVALPLVLILLGAQDAGAADFITLASSGKSVSGKVTGVSKTEITIQAGLGSVKTEKKIPANDIQRIRWDGEPAGFQLALNAERQGRYADALKRFREFQQAGTENPFLKTDLEFLIARTTARMALADPATLDEAVKALGDFLKAHPDSFRYYEALSHLGELYLAAENYNQAQQVFGELAQAPWNDYKMAARLARARLLLKQENTAEALREFDAVAAMPAQGPSEEARKNEALLGKAVCLQRSGQHQQALEVFDMVIDRLPADQTRLQAECYVRQGDSYRALNQTKAAILAYLHVEVLAQLRKESDLHAEALYRLAQLLKIDGQDARSAELAGRLETLYPNSRWGKQLTAGGV